MMETPTQMDDDWGYPLGNLHVRIHWRGSKILLRIHTQLLTCSTWRMGSYGFPTAFNSAFSLHEAVVIQTVHAILIVWLVV
jgi:hypothetical protein